VKNVAIVLMDTIVNGTPNGGSGKTFLIEIIGKIRQLAILDGKNYDQGRWQKNSSVGVDSEIVLFDDIEQKFKLEKIFPAITTAFQIVQLYKSDIVIPFEKSPKIAITTNYAINGDGESFKRRLYEFEVTNTFSSSYTPFDKYGRRFFEEWSIADFNCFYNIMVQCLQSFLNNGLVKSEPINLKKSKLINISNLDFVEFIEDAIEVNVKYEKSQLFKTFTDYYPDNKEMTQRTFTEWLRGWGKFKSYEVNESHSGYNRHIIFYN
jgi:hypothetical protein